MTQTFYFYDLETSGVSPSKDRIMQFAGQRTTLALEPIGEPDNIIVALAADVLPSPDAVLVHGITPQQSIAEGITEAEFLRYFHKHIAQSGTIFLGFNTVRFDDEFMRFTNYRNLYDPYGWQWEDGKSRWDLLDVVRMTRALRPEGINWPFDANCKPTNRLELLSSLNNIEHSNAHDALADVLACISLARLIRSKQPKLFDYLLNIRDKKQVKNLILSGDAFVYCSGKYSGDYEKTTVVHTICEHPDKRGALVYNLRVDPSPYLNMTSDQLVEAWQLDWDDPKRLPVKTLKYNRCPAVAPLSVFDEDSQKRLKLSLKNIEEHQKLLIHSDLATALSQAVQKLDMQRQTRLLETEHDVDASLYDAFINNHDKKLLEKAHQSEPENLSAEQLNFQDNRLKVLLPLFKARNFPKSLSNSEQKDWQKHIDEVFQVNNSEGRLGQFMSRIEELKKTAKTKRDLYLLEELELFGLSLIPSDSF